MKNQRKKFELVARPGHQHRSSQGDDSFFGADLGYNEYDNPCDRLLPPCGSPSSQSNSVIGGIPESPATSPTTPASNYHQTDEVFVAVDRSEGEFKVVTGKERQTVLVAIFVNPYLIFHFMANLDNE